VAGLESGRADDRRDPVTCVVVDARSEVLSTIPRVLASHHIRVVATASTGDGALAAIRRHEPAVAICDPKVGGLSVLGLARVAPATRVILYASFRDRDDLTDAIAQGVWGIVLKEAPFSDLVRAIHTITEGGIYIDPLLAGVYAAAYAQQLTTETDLPEAG